MGWSGFGGKGVHKFKAKAVERHGIKFASTGEADRYDKLLLAQQHGLISDLKTQVPFKLEVNGQLICTYRADFTYDQDGVKITEDLKGFVTPEFKLKFKLMQAVHGITILLTSATGKPKDINAPKKKKKSAIPKVAKTNNLRKDPKTGQTALKF